MTFWVNGQESRGNEIPDFKTINIVSQIDTYVYILGLFKHLELFNQLTFEKYTIKIHKKINRDTGSLNVQMTK